MRALAFVVALLFAYVQREAACLAAHCCTTQFMCPLYLSREIESLLTKLFKGPPRPNEKKLFMEKFDTNGDGIVTWTEFSTTIQRLKGGT